MVATIGTPQSASAQRSSIIASAYVSLWVAYYFLVHASNHSDGKHVRLKELNPAALILSVEIVKLLVSSGIFTAQVGVRTIWRQARSIHRGRTAGFLLKQYFPVALLYAAYNNLMIVNLRFFDPTTYLILSSTRLIMTAAAWQFAFGQKVSPGKRKALVVITLGVLIKESPQFFGAEEKSDSTTNTDPPMSHAAHMCLVLAQMLCSVMATVYNEVLLKKHGSNKNVHTQLQNVCLYMDSVFINMAALFLHPLFMVLTSSTAPTTSFATSLSLLFSSALPMAMILTLAAVGIVTSLMLRHINSVAKAVASSTEVAITTILGSVFFGYQITPLVLVSVALVAGGAYIYATDKDGGDGGGVAVAVFVPVLAPPRRKRYSMRIGRIGTALLTGATAYSGCASYLALKAATSQHSNSAQDHKEHLGFALVVLQKPANQGRRFKTAKGWFEDDGTNFLAHSATELNLRHKNSAWLDENLHRLSRWSFSSSEWERFEQMHLWSNPMLKVILAAEGCRVLEIGSGAGAFSRSLSLRLYDNVHVSGVDYSDKLVAVSRMAVSKKTPRFNAHVLASMEDATSMRAAIANASNMNGVAEQKPSFHVVTMIGSLCYMPHPNSVVMALTNALENLKIGGLLVASTMLLPQTMMAMGSYCKTLVTRDMLIEMSSILRYDILSIVDMEPWGIGDQKGQYLAILRKTGSANNNYQPANQSPTGPALYTGNSTGLGTDWPESTKPPNVRRKKFERFRTGQKVLEYIIRKLQEKGVPVAITYGTALHEFRAGNGISFKPRITDKDIDIAVFEQHLALVPDMDVDIRRLFGWKVVSVSIERLYVKIVPLDDFRKRGQPTDISFQLDVYGFRCNAMDNLVKFPWDKTSARLNAFLPLRQHVSLQAPLSNGTQSHVYMPSDPACFLENMYGADFRTPADTKFFRRMAIDSPICAERVLGASERLELMRQLVFCGGCSASSANMEVVANVTSGLPAKAPLCS